MIGIVFNPVTFSGKSVDRMKHFLGILDERGVEYTYRETTCEGDAVRIAAELAETCDIIVPAGGDGTVYETVNGAISKDPTFMILPFGSGNDIARSVGVNGLSDEELADILLAGKTRPMDYLVSDGKASMVYVSFGIVVNIIRDFKDPNNARKSYNSTVLASVRRSRPRRYRIRTPTMDRELSADFISTQNTATAGGGMVITAEAKDDDGKMDLVIIEHKNVVRKYLNILALNKGKVSKQPNAIVERTEWEEITPLDGIEWYSVDGELLTTNGLRVDICGKQMRVICP
ncbi:MAG: hypothetical protein J6Y18_04260 [Candidatus Methanomethylophilaceae archaeon]|nr:hypothetical protein [Candidatus Methanomethylophilaceae archaeon]